MAEEIRCPNCGGMLFSDDTEAMSLSPCTCADTKSQRTVTKAKSVGNSSVLASLSATLPDEVKAAASAGIRKRPLPADPVEFSLPPATATKVCTGCGKNLAGQRRFKDTDGNYWCPECGKKNKDSSKAQAKSEPRVATPPPPVKAIPSDPSRTDCPRCGANILTQNLMTYEGAFVCPKCHRELKEIEKQADVRLKKINQAFETKDYKRLIPYFVILAILGLIIVVQLIRRITGF